MQADEVNILSGHGINNINKVYWNLTTADLYEHAILNHEGKIAHRGPLVCTTGKHTGRSPNDKFIVQEPAAENVSWG
ncbi:phosphoenolpyruvate carboxykinase (ATP), partial [bacterium]|nr:phosphoenolpyruvate carboxykinase (ATP) [bacterium]